MNDCKEKEDYCVSGLGFRWTGRTGDGSRERTAEIDPSKTDGRDRSVYDRLTEEGDDDVSDDVTTGGGGSAARACMLAGERRRFGTNGEHQRVERDAANSPVTKGAAEDQRTATATTKKRRRSSGRRRRWCSGDLRRRRRGGRGRRRDGDHDGGLPERRRRLERRRRTAGATAALGHTALGRYGRREAKAKVAAGEKVEEIPKIVSPQSISPETKTNGRILERNGGGAKLGFRAAAAGG
uniref:Uncharacterized protein n=1 Tax=Oryza sativa subsp. japonica TaxID=39947 RepID=Q6ERF9_ORYSJ|nr:hypothetical protein [Oryza sativa Japonica Group]